MSCATEAPGRIFHPASRAAALCGPRLPAPDGGAPLQRNTRTVADVDRSLGSRVDGEAGLMRDPGDSFPLKSRSSLLVLVADTGQGWLD